MIYPMEKQTFNTETQHYLEKSCLDSSSKLCIDHWLVSSSFIKSVFFQLHVSKNLPVSKTGRSEIFTAAWQGPELLGFGRLNISAGPQRAVHWSQLG